MLSRNQEDQEPNERGAVFTSPWTPDGFSEFVG